MHCCFTPRDTTCHWLTPVLCAGLRTPTVSLALLPILVTTPGSNPSTRNPISPFKYKTPEKKAQTPMKIPGGLHLLIFFVRMDKKACSWNFPVHMRYSMAHSFPKPFTYSFVVNKRSHHSIPCIIPPIKETSPFLSPSLSVKSLLKGTELNLCQ